MVRNLLAVFGRKETPPPRVFVVSYPRSGHHALIGFLNRVTDVADNYCEFYSCERHDGKEIECSKKNISWKFKNNCCGAERNILKNHDFDLKLPYRSEDKFIIQYRHPFLSIKSWYEMELAKGNPLDPWPKFFDKKLKFWIAFVKKWVVELGGQPNVLAVTYNSLKDREVILQIAEFSGAEISSNIDDFKHNFKDNSRAIDSDIDFFKEKEKAIEKLLIEVNISPLFSDP